MHSINQVNRRKLLWLGYVQLGTTWFWVSGLSSVTCAVLLCAGREILNCFPTLVSPPAGVGVGVAGVSGGLSLPRDSLWPCVRA